MPTEQTDVSPRPLTFVSHSSKDKLIADAICARLESQGIRCWIAPRDVDPGRDYSNQIADALEKSAVMVMVVSSGSNTSRHVKSEIDRAFSLGQVIVPFRVENIELDKGLAYYLSKTHWLDAVSPPLEQHIDHLAATIRKLFNQDPPEQPLPAPSLPAQPISQVAANKRSLPLLAGVFGLVAVIGVLGFLLFTSRENTKVAASSAPKKVAKHHASPSPGPSPASAVLADQPSIEGTWKIAKARALDGSSYSGTVQFTKQGERYLATWQTTAGTYSGFGLVRGNKLCIGWGAESLGVVFYKIDGRGTLNGKWIVTGTSAELSDGVENATGGTPGKLEGHYLITGLNPGSQAPYAGQLDITRTGATYQMHWKVDQSSNTGVAIEVDDDLFAAWGDKDHAAGVVSYTFEGKGAKGVWTMGGESETGTENLVRQ
jgi:TIR domain